MKRVLTVGINLFLFGFFPLSLALSTLHGHIRFQPSPVEIKGFTLSFPLTWQRRLLSSVPFREKALDDITVTLINLCVIRGASSSGKSTLLKAILHQTQQPTAQTSGTVTLTTRSECAPPKPIYLDQKPPYEARLRIEEIIEQHWSRNGEQISVVLDESTRQQITSLFAGYLGFQDSPNDEWLRQKPSQLSPSESYRFALLVACLQSSCSCDFQQVGDDEILVPAPILLLDEWMDTETSTVIQSVQRSLWMLVQATGALVVSVTHKPERWKPHQISQTITLSAGKILRVESS